MWKIYSNYPEMWDSMLSDISSAERSVKFEQFIFTDLEEGSIGKRFIDLFKEKAGKGLEVKLILDGFGSSSLAFSSELTEMEKSGVKVAFHTASSHKLGNLRLLRPILKYFFRDHKKLLVIDEKVAHIGGGIVQDKAREWGEFNVRFEEAEVVGNLNASFDKAWQSLEEKKAFTLPEPVTDREGFTVLGNGPGRSQHHVLSSILENVSSAKRYIRIATPYFVPTFRLMREMIKARRRGVDIEIIVPEKIDNVFAKFSSRYYYHDILKRGMKLFFYQEFNHAKAVVVDGQWGSAGSTNLDRLSLAHNYELNIATKDAEFIKDMERCFDIYLAKSRQIELREWEKRPALSKILEELSFFIRPWA